MVYLLLKSLRTKIKLLHFVTNHTYVVHFTLFFNNLSIIKTTLESALRNENGILKSKK